MSKKFIRKPKLPTLRRRKGDKVASGSESTVSRITNETVAEAREDVLGSARKLIYPLTHSKHRVLVVSSVLVIAALIGFTSTMMVLIYRREDHSDFTYQVSKVLPFPAAKVGGTFVPYENYLFELKRYVYYYNNVESIDFNNPVYKPQLDDQKQKILERIVNQAYIRKIANEKGIGVSDEEIDKRIETLKEQNRLGNNDKVFEDTLRDFYNWSVNDFRRSIRNDILLSKVLGSVDVEARTEANQLVETIRGGDDFAALAAQHSDDPITKDKGGEYPGTISPTDRNLSSEVVSALATLKPGEVSEPINVGYGFEIIKKLEDKDGRYRAAHILITFKETNELLNDYKAKDKAVVYIKP